MACYCATRSTLLVPLCRSHCILNHFARYAIQSSSTVSAILHVINATSKSAESTDRVVLYTNWLVRAVCGEDDGGIRTRELAANPARGPRLRSSLACCLRLKHPMATHEFSPNGWFPQLQLPPTRLGVSLTRLGSYTLLWTYKFFATDRRGADARYTIQI